MSSEIIPQDLVFDSRTVTSRGTARGSQDPPIGPRKKLLAIAKQFKADINATFNAVLHLAGSHLNWEVGATYNTENLCWWVQQLGGFRALNEKKPGYATVYLYHNLFEGNEKKSANQLTTSHNRKTTKRYEQIQK